MKTERRPFYIDLQQKKNICSAPNDASNNCVQRSGASEILKVPSVLCAPPADAKRSADNAPVKMTLIQAIAFWEMGLLSSDQLPAIAAEALEVGFDCLSPRMLAGETEHIGSTVGPLFSRAISELGIPTPDHRTASKIVAACYAAGILDGTWSPYEGARMIWWNVANVFDKDPEIWGQLVQESRVRHAICNSAPVRTR